MGYLHIDNLYKAQEILAFKQCYALEKIHGTSAHVGWVSGEIKVFSGGEPYERFKSLFDLEVLAKTFLEKFGEEEVIFYGEAYGGKQQGMSKTYGPELKFVVFDVKKNGAWVGVEHAAGLSQGCGFEFVDFSLIDTSMEAINAERDKPSTQAVRNGIIEPKIREGVVLRPPYEVTLWHGGRVIAKHKRAEFSERGKPDVDLDPSKREILVQADAIAQEWVTPMRLEHVLDKLKGSLQRTVETSDIPLIIRAMNEDISREASGEIIESPEARKAIGRLTVTLFKQKLNNL